MDRIAYFSRHDQCSNLLSAPSSAVDSLQSMYSALSAASASHLVIVCGDFNAPGVDWVTPTVKSPVTETLCQLVCDNFSTQLVSTPTRGDSVLDLLLTSNTNLISSFGVVDSLPGCDHDAFQLSFHKPKHSTTKRMLYITIKQLILMTLEKFYLWDVINFDKNKEKSVILQAIGIK